MPEVAGNGRERVLDPVERLSEVLFGLIMVLSFTCSISAASAGREEVREVVVGALGCNLAWGIVDAIMYLVGMTLLLERGRGLAIARGGARLPEPRARAAAHGRDVAGESRWTSCSTTRARNAAPPAGRAPVLRRKPRLGTHDRRGCARRVLARG